MVGRPATARARGGEADLSSLFHPRARPPSWWRLREERDSLYVCAGGVACALASDTETSRRGFRKARRDGDGDGCFVRFIRSQVKVTVTIQS